VNALVEEALRHQLNPDNLEFLKAPTAAKSPELTASTTTQALSRATLYSARSWMGSATSTRATTRKLGVG
jgi:hypothetical protein